MKQWLFSTLEQLSFFGYALETEHCVQIIDFVDGAFFWRDDNEAISTWFVRGWTHRADTKHNRVVNDVESRFMSSHFAHGTLFDVVMKDGLITITAVNNAGLYLHHVVLVHLTCSAFFCLLTFFSLSSPYKLKDKRKPSSLWWLHSSWASLSIAFLCVMQVVCGGFPINDVIEPHTKVCSQFHREDHWPSPGGFAFTARIQVFRFGWCSSIYHHHRHLDDREHFW